MNVEQALHHAKESEEEGLRGLYPTVAQVLAEEVVELREKFDVQKKTAFEQTQYAISLQLAIEAHCRDEHVLEDGCPHHSEKLNKCLEDRHNGRNSGAAEGGPLE